LARSIRAKSHQPCSTVNEASRHANRFTYSATIQIFDADGNLIVTLCGRSTGTRFE